MELKHLRTFLALSEIRNFTRTAEKLHFAQSNVTTHIQQLERELNVQLFERIGKRIALTPAGKELIPYAVRMLALSDDVTDRFTNHGAGGAVTVGASESVCISRLPAALKIYQNRYPEVQVYLRVIDTDRVMTLLEENVIDIAFILDEERQYPYTVTSFSVCEPIAVLARPEHPLAAREVVSVTDFMDMPMILTGPGCCYRSMFERELRAAAVSPRVMLETGSIQVIKQMVLSGVGLGLLPEAAVCGELEQGSLVRLNYPAAYPISSRLLCHKDKWMTEHLKNFISAVIAAGSCGCRPGKTVLPGIAATS